MIGNDSGILFRRGAMMKLLLTITCLISCCAAPAFAEDEDPIAKKVAAAKETFYADRDKAEKQLLELMTRRENTAKQAGDLKNLEAIRAEIAAFRSEGTLPKFVSPKDYEMAMKLAKTKLENAYTAGIKSYTQADKLDQAKELQKSLDELNQTSKPVAAAPQDFFQPKTSWTNDKRTIFLTVTERQGEDFKANYVMHTPQGKKRMTVNGKIKNGNISWDGKDAIEADGKPSIADVRGVLGKDENGNKIDLVKTLPRNGEKTTFILTPNKE
jgi:hypothetical protein